MDHKKQFNLSYAFDYTGTPQVFHAFPGKFKIQLWGARGIKVYDPTANGCSKVTGKGAYVSGMIQIKEVVDLFVFVGEQGKSGGGFNSNSQLMTISGGGATDIRLTNTTNWYDFDSLKSRIMVAAGAGSGERYCGGDGGSLIGLSTDSTYSKPGYLSLIHI